MASERELNCLVCGSSLLEGRIAKCPRCVTAHHEECWDYNGGCAMFGCQESASVREPSAPLPGKQAPGPIPAQRPAPSPGMDRWRNILVPVIAVVAMQAFNDNSTPPPAKSTRVVPAVERTRHSSRGQHPHRWSDPSAPRLVPEWQAELPGMPLPDAVAAPLQDGHPFVSYSYDQSGGFLHGLDVETGRPLWTNRIGKDGRDATNILAAALGYNVAVLTREAMVVVYDRATGRERSVRGLPRTPENPEVLGIDHKAVSLGGPGLVVELSEPHPYSFEMLSCQVPFTCKVLGAGRGVAVIQERDTLSLIDMRTEKPLWTHRFPSAATTALVREKYIIVGGTSIWVFDRSTGRLIEAHGTASSVRRLDERSNLLYVHTGYRLQVFDLNTRRFLHQVRNARDFQYLPFVDAVLSPGNQFRLLWPESGEEVTRLSLQGKRPSLGDSPGVVDTIKPHFVTSPAGRIRYESGRLFMAAQADGNNHRIICYGVVQAPK